MQEMQEIERKRDINIDRHLICTSDRNTGSQNPWNWSFLSTSMTRRLEGQCGFSFKWRTFYKEVHRGIQTQGLSQLRGRA